LLAAEIYAAHDQLDFVEVLADHFFTHPDELKKIAEVFTVIPHGVGLSIGTAGPVDQEYLAAARRVSDVSDAPYYTDHVCMTRVPGIDLGHLAPLWFNEEILSSTIANVRQVQEYLGKPLVLETITNLVADPDPAMSQTEFFGRLTEETDCGILLDVTNVYTNSVNHIFDPAAFIRELPLEHVIQVHLAGGQWQNGVLIDSHSRPVPDEVWELYGGLCEKADVRAVVLEQDNDLSELPPLLEQVWRARRIMKHDDSAR
jgi:hypothetical protein